MLCWWGWPATWELDCSANITAPTIQAAGTIKAIGHLQGQRSGNPPADAITHLFQRLSISLWRGNAILWIGRTPIGSPEVDGVM